MSPSLVAGENRGAVDDRMNRDTTTTNDHTELAGRPSRPPMLLMRALALCVSRRSNNGAGRASRMAQMFDVPFNDRSEGN